MKTTALALLSLIGVLGQSFDQEYVQINGRVSVVRGPSSPIMLDAAPAAQLIVSGLGQPLQGVAHERRT